ncbi:hydantoinase B/oxoprolinase family protein [Mesorhizobium sp. M0522]|uniref:hydantoinase B/oxoprolinase family protein n=1 Tax=Mesorhizobium sp. M0522 TaxID=2956958 RepID=UPI0033358508
MSIDNVNLTVLANYCAAAAESMGWTLMRTAHSTFVKETEDFSCQILTPAGLTVASPKTFGATWFTGLDYSGVIGKFDCKEGDIFVVSDPYTGFVSTHTPDTHMWKPVFYEDELMCFVANHIHNTDVGGAVPASLSRSLTEIHQEGLRIPPIRIVRDGRIDENLKAIISRNVRNPEQNWGDLNAQIAAVNVGERKVHEIIRRFGKDDFRSGLGQLLDYAEKQARAVIASLPDGDYFFSDYADEDQAGGYPVRMALMLRIHGDTITLDFTGSDPQLTSSLNMPTGGNERHSLVMVGLVYALYCLDPNIMLNYGVVRPAKAILPPGSIVNAIEPSAVGMRSLTSMLLQITTFGAFCIVCPERMPACPGSESIMNVKTADRNGRTVMASLGPISGGAGGDWRADGAEGSGANGGFCKNTPVEINEAEVPIAIARYGLVPDSGGAGRWRGGLAMEMEFKIFAPESIVTARNRDRSRFAPWGVAGGHAGGTSTFTKNPGQLDAVDLGNADVVTCDPGDTILIRGPGGGGYGDPLERPAETVLTDYKRGMVSRERARHDYAVEISSDGRLDLRSTADLRATRKADPMRTFFGHNRYRIEFERIWTPQRYAMLTSILETVPVTWRFFVKHRIFGAIGEKLALDDGGAENVTTAYHALCEEFTDLPRFHGGGEHLSDLGKSTPVDESRDPVSSFG